MLGREPKERVKGVKALYPRGFGSVSLTLPPCRAIDTLLAVASEIFMRIWGVYSFAIAARVELLRSMVLIGLDQRGECISHLFGLA